VKSNLCTNYFQEYIASLFVKLVKYISMNNKLQWYSIVFYSLFGLIKII